MWHAEDGGDNRLFRIGVSKLVGDNQRVQPYGSTSQLYQVCILMQLLRSLHLNVASALLPCLPIISWQMMIIGQGVTGLESV